MAKIQDILFSLIVTIVLFIVVGNIVLSVVLDDYDIPQRSYLEGRAYQKASEVLAEPIQDGQFQKSAEQYIADRLPNRDLVLLNNAKLQRHIIELSNAPCAFPVYPSFYDSRYLIWPDKNAILEAPSKKKIETEEVVDKAVGTYASLMERHPRINWAFALVERSRISPNTPAHDLVSDPADYQYYSDALKRVLPASCSIVDLSQKDAEEYFEHYFKTDHHQQVVGGIDAYTKILQVFGRHPIEFKDVYAASEEPFFGSGARESLVIENEMCDFVEDVSYSHGDYQVVADGAERSADFLSHGLSETGAAYEKENKYANMYAGYFHTDYGLIEIRNDSAPEGSLLIIGDSFTNNMDYFFAENYRQVFVVDPRYCKFSVDEFVAAHQIDDAVFLMASNNMIDKSVLKKLSSK